MQRREFIILLAGAALALPGVAIGQTSSRVFRLATLTPGLPRDASSPEVLTMMRVLSERGYVVGKNLTFDARGARGQTTTFAHILEDLRASKTDIVVTVGYTAATAAKASGIPVVIAWGSGDPVATGLINSLAHPGGMVTGMSDDAAMVSTKRLSILKQMLPNMQRLAMLWNRDDLGMTLRYEASAATAKALGLDILALGVREPDDFNGVFEAMDSQKPDAILMVSDVLTNLNRKRVFDYAAARRIPAIYEEEQFVRDGGLMSYGADPNESFRRAGELVAQIFGGRRPADIPFEQPTRYRFVVNLKTARDIGFDIPANLVALADEVIE